MKKSKSRDKICTEEGSERKMIKENMVEEIVKIRIKFKIRYKSGSPLCWIDEIKRSLKPKFINGGGAHIDYGSYDYETMIG